MSLLLTNLCDHKISIVNDNWEGLSLKYLHYFIYCWPFVDAEHFSNIFFVINIKRYVNNTPFSHSFLFLHVYP